MENSSPHEGTWFSQSTNSDTNFSAFNIWTEKDQVYAQVHNRDFASTKYIRGSVLGQGGWSTVYKIQRVQDGKIVAGKASTSVNQLYKETKMLRKLSHKHILEFIELYKEPGKEDATLLITELCAEGTLHMRINHAPGGMGKQEILLATSQISDALAYLHGRGYFHSDIKPRNILVRRLDPISVALADCADCKVYESYRGPPGGTPNYWSPEMTANNRHAGRSDDMWALGISLLGMTGQWPRCEKTKVGLARYPRQCANHALELQKLNPGHGMVSLLARLLAWKARERITAEKCYEVTVRLLEETEGEENAGTEGLRIKSPEEFRPISFW
ncbi:kinase-like domain-containing protein [Trichoderma austrokoningii]